jgi:hypothetical protein
MHRVDFCALFGSDLIPLIELPSSVLSNDCRQGEQPIVLVRPLAFVQDVATIHLEPLSVSDWELLESDAQFLEEGGLLQQVSLVYSNQILPLQVKGRDMVHVKVLPPADHSKDLPCWRLMANTEVIVNPPLQLNSAFCRFETHQLRVYPTRLDYSDAMQRLAEQCSVDLVSLGTGRGCVHPKTLRLLQGYRDNELSGEIGETYGDEEEVFAHIELIEPKSGRATTTTNCQVVRLVPSENRIPPDHIGTCIVVLDSQTTIPRSLMIHTMLIPKRQLLFRHEEQNLQLILRLLLHMRSSSCCWKTCHSSLSFP